jgi:membrane associated rhomboid family serine protease
MTPDAPEPERPVSPFHRLLYERTPRLIVTPALVAILTIVYAAMVYTSREVSFSTETLIAWGALSGPYIGSGEWWRLASAMFLHGNPPHLILNAIALWRLGAIVERLLGPPVFLIVYLLTGLIASATSVQFHGSELVGVGASGAIFGIVGALLAMVLIASTSLRRTPPPPAATPFDLGVGFPLPLPTPQDTLRSMLAELRQGVFTMVVYSLVFSFMPGVDMAAHVGGLLAGIAIGAFVGRHVIDARPSITRTLVPALLTIALVAVQIPRLGVRVDLPTEFEKSSTAGERANAAFEQAWGDVEAGRKTPEDAADALAREVLPPIRDARTRAASILADLQGRMHASTAADARGGPDWRQVQVAYAWDSYLAAYEDAWQLRIRGLRTHDRATIAEAARHARDAVDGFERILKNSRAGHRD